MWDLTDVDFKIKPEILPGKSVADILISTKRFRPTGKPNQANRRYLESVVPKDRPLKLLIMWGAAKVYGQFSLREPDLLDVIALSRLAALQLSIRKYHPPGIEVSILWEDNTRKLLSGEDDGLYYRKFMDLKNHLGLDFITVVTESSLVDARFEQVADRNALAIFNGRESKVGWKGNIAWDFYIARAKSKYPTYSNQQLRWEAASYLGIALARYQLGVTVDHDVKFSFCPYPSNVPQSMRKGRVEHKLKPTRVNGKTTPPWCGYSFATRQDWSIVTASEYRKTDFAEMILKINGFPIRVLTDV